MFVLPNLGLHCRVSRHPVQQALLLLKNQGLLREFGRRGLEAVGEELATSG